MGAVVGSMITTLGVTKEAEKGLMEGILKGGWTNPIGNAFGAAVDDGNVNSEGDAVESCIVDSVGVIEK